MSAEGSGHLKPRTKVNFDLSAPVKINPLTEREAKIIKSTKPNKELNAKISKVTRNLNEETYLEQNSFRGVPVHCAHHFAMWECYEDARRHV